MHAKHVRHGVRSLPTSAKIGRFWTPAHTDLQPLRAHRCPNFRNRYRLDLYRNDEGLVGEPESYEVESAHNPSRVEVAEYKRRDKMDRSFVQGAVLAEWQVRSGLASIAVFEVTTSAVDLG